MKVVLFYDKEAERYLQCMEELAMDCRLCFLPPFETDYSMHACGI